ncbi:calcium-binding protein [Roseovarius aestuariivivens]|uniref:calcium-binding protein n=1 Tax=Roseovarius aestuariivivens TaxID=1888910 RepID=UPI001436BC0C|nr:calcium-binding protein [Roseovarius aestuariivivens]
MFAGSNGDENLWTFDGADLVNGGLGNDTADAGEGNDTINGEDGDDVLFGGPGDDELNGGPGGDILDGGNGIDAYNGGAGNDTIRLGGLLDDGVSIEGGEQIDTIELQGHLTVGIFRPNGVEQIDTGGFAINGGPEIDLRGLTTVGPSDVVVNTSIWSDIVWGTNSNDIVNGSYGNDTFDGGDGDDTLIGSFEADLLIGGAGNDTFIVGVNAGRTTFDGGSGIDTIHLDESMEVGNFNPVGVERIFSNGNIIRINADEIPARTVDLRDLTSVDSSGSTISTGVRVDSPFAGMDIIYGTEQNDTLNSLFGDDTINGYYGDDTIDGGVGGDLLIGGPGSDWIYVDDAGDRVAESRKWAGHDTVVSEVDFRMGRKHIEDLELTGTARLGAGNGLQNRITGNDGDNVIDGGKNNDTMVGGLGDDRYILRTPGDVIVEEFGEGNDVVLAYQSYALAAHVEQLFMQTVRTKDGSPAIFNGIGNGLDNTIVGTPFSNTIVGREGRDTLKGQRGADTFVFDRAIGPDNVDRIIDFNTNEANEGDILKMKGTVFGGMAAGALSAADFVAGTAAADASDRFIFDQASGQLWFDADGSGAGAQELIATFEQNATVTAADIEIF